MGEGKKQKLTLFITSFVSESQTPGFVIWNFCSWSYMEALVKWIATHRVNGNSKGWIGSLRMDTGRNTCTCVGPLAHQWFNQQSDHLLSCEMQFMSFLSDELWWLNPKVTQWNSYCGNGVPWEKFSYALPQQRCTEHCGAGSTHGLRGCIASVWFSDCSRITSKIKTCWLTQFKTLEANKHH